MIPDRLTASCSCVGLPREKNDEACMPLWVLIGCSSLHVYLKLYHYELKKKIGRRIWTHIEQTYSDTVERRPKACGCCDMVKQENVN
jgi:hypothetical protein